MAQRAPKPSASKVITAMDARLQEATSSKPDKRKIHIYATGIQQKLTHSRIALQMLREYTADSQRDDTSERTFNTREAVAFYTDAFFFCLYSALDIQAQIICMAYHLSGNEKDISFTQIANKLKQECPDSDPAKALRTQISDFQVTPNYLQLIDYRHCSTHRRPIPIHVSSSDHIREENEVGGYSNYTRRITLHKNFFVLADDIRTFHPTYKKNRELCAYCSKILSWFDGKLSSFATKIQIQKAAK